MASESNIEFDLSYFSTDILKFVHLELLFFALYYFYFFLTFFTNFIGIPSCQNGLNHVGISSEFGNFGHILCLRSKSNNPKNLKFGKLVVYYKA